MKKFLLATFGIFALVLNCISASLTLAWDAPSDPTIVGYKIYYGGASRLYTNSIIVGNVLTATISNLNNSSTYYLAAVSRNFAGAESDFSNEVSVSIPAIVTNAPPTISFITNQVINMNYTSPKIAFSVYDVDSPMTNLVLTYNYSNTNLFNTNSFLFVGTSTNRNLYLTPISNRVGTSTISLIVSDNFSNNVSSSFSVTVNSPQNLVYIVTRLEYGTNLNNIQRTNILLTVFTNPPINQFYRQYLVITNRF